MKLIKKNLLALLIVAFMFFIPVALIHSDQNPPENEGKIINPLGANGPQSIPAFIHDVLIGVVKIGIPIIALAIIYCGFLFVAARGKPEAITKAKDALLYTLIGAGLLLGAWAIANLIVDVIGNLN